MDQQSLPSAASSSPTPSIATQPETQESESSLSCGEQPIPTQPFTQQPTTTSLPSSFAQKMTESPTFTQQTQAFQLLQTQPITQVEQHHLAGTQNFSQWGEEGNGYPQITQPVTQQLSEIAPQLHDSEQCGDHHCETSGTMNVGRDNEDNALGEKGSGGSTIEDGQNDSVDAAMQMQKSSSSGEQLPSVEQQINSSSLEAPNNSSIPAMDGTKFSLESINSAEKSTGNAPVIAPRIMPQQPMEITEATAHSRKMPKQPQQQVDPSSNGTNPTAMTTKAPCHAKRTVTNPYTKYQKTPVTKRSIDQISQSSTTSSSVATAASSNVSSNNDQNDTHNKNNPINPSSNAAYSNVAAPPSRKPVFNPYAKSKQTSKQAVRNPYAKMTATTPAAATAAAGQSSSSSANNTASLPLQKIAMKSTPTTDSFERKRLEAAKPAAAAIVNNLPQFRRAGISLSLPMAERLPSRNVSYQPAEILTVGELYRYLYNDAEDGAGKQQQQQQQSAMQQSSSECQSSKELVSVRITGTLLAVATPSHDESNMARTNQYDSGTFIVIGDPLENTRFLKKKEVPPPDQDSDGKSTTTAAIAATPSISKANPKAGGLTSILRNKKTPAAAPLSAKSANTPSCSKPAAKKSLTSDASAVATIENEQPPTETPSVKSTNNESNENNAASATSNRSKSSVNRGILNTNKKKKLVYSGGAKRLSFGGGDAKRLSFGGGGGLGDRGKGGLLGRKFVTPKRMNVANGPLASVVKRDVTNNRGASSLFSSTKKGSSISYAKSLGAAGVKRTSLEYIIPRHPSPIVPVWIGSCYNGDGLDGSIVSNLVMIMGEIVIEHCASCAKRNSEASDDSDSDSDDENIDGSATDANETDVSSKEKNTHQQPPVYSSTPAPIRSVNDAATSISACTRKISEGEGCSTSQTQMHSQNNSINKIRKTFCCQCTRFLRARFVKNANGTDMSLQKEALKARRAYIAERKRQMGCLMPNNNSVLNKGLYSLGCGPPT